MYRIDNLLQICDVINEASKRLTALIGEPVKIRLLHPDIKGFDYIEPLPKRFYEDILIKNIIELVCNEFGITVGELRERRRHRRYVDARKLVSYIMHHHSKQISEELIGQALNCHRTNVFHLLKTASDLIEVDKIFSGKYMTVMDKLEEILNNNKVAAN